MVRRGIAPRIGELALPGGFIEVGESWEAGAARELREEAGVEINPNEIKVVDVVSTPDTGSILIFGISNSIRIECLPPFQPTNETTERMIVYDPLTLAFPLHTRMLSRFL